MRSSERRRFQPDPCRQNGSGLRALVSKGTIVASFALLLPTLVIGQRVNPGVEVESAASIIQKRTKVQAFARVEDQTGVARAIYRPAVSVSEAGSPDEVARTILKAEKRIGWSGKRDELRLVDDRSSRAGRHLTYQQEYRGVPVLGSSTRVSIDKAGRPSFIVNGFSPEVATAGLDVSPGVGSDAARSAAMSVFENGVTKLGEPRLVIVPDDQPFLSWALFAWPEQGGEFEVYVDAKSGSVVRVRDWTLHKSPTPSLHNDRPVISDPSSIARDLSGTSVVEGKGLVFDPDPLATSGKDYAPPFVDDDDAEIAELNAERKQVDLPDITLFPDQLHRLIGPHVEVTGRRSNGQLNYDPPEELSPTGFAYTRGDERFEGVMVYYHVDASQRYVQSLGFDNVQNFPLPVNPFGEGNADVSNYYLNLNYLALGGGGVDDAEDAFVIWHEYGHALLNAAVPGLAGNFAGTAIHEGWSDYWAASYQRAMFESGKLPAGDWKRLFRWDGNNPNINWFGRNLPDVRVYPNDLNGSSVHQDGLVWASAMMAVYDRLGRRITDELNIQSHFYMTAPATMEDAAYAVIQADVDLYGGAHASDLVAVLGSRGFVDASSFETLVEHVPITDTEQLGGVLPVTADVTAILSPVASATIVYFVGDASGSVPMTSTDGTQYVGAIPLPDEASLVSYFIEIVDEQDNVVRRPADAPESLFSFAVGPDAEAPEITHTPLTQTSVFGWPPTIEAVITDNIAVDTAYVEYRIVDDETAEVLVDSSFGLGANGSVLSGLFPDVDFTLRGRETVTYRVHAVDASSAANETILPAPEDPPFIFALSVSGVVARFDFEQDRSDVVTTGSFERGRPSFGSMFAHSGTQAWVTVLDDAYPAAQGTATITLPVVDLTEVDQVWLQFWHWYDLEHDGRAEPGSSVDATLWDGGNVQISVDDGATWSIVTPEGGYDGTIAAGGGNPKQTEPAFGGYSFGWRRELIPITGGTPVHIRFEFGSDVSNNESAVAFAGWMIDDVQVIADRPVDTESPEALRQLPVLTELGAGGASSAPARISIDASDDTGIESVMAVYSVSGPLGTNSGTIRLDMSADSPNVFAGEIPLAGGPVPGLTIDYQLTLRDFDGNQRMVPEGSGRARISYVYIEETNIVSRATPSGGWSQENNTWRIDESSHNGSRAALVFAPMDLPVDATSIRFELNHGYRLQSGARGRLSVAVGSADSWEPIDPDNDYPGGESTFLGIVSDETSVYDLGFLAGRHVWLRLDMFAEQPLESNEFWQVDAASLVFRGETSELEIPRSLDLHPSYPNPFSTSATISYSVPTAGPILIEVFDVMGRRIEILTDRDHEVGTYTINWQPSVSPGLYLIRLVGLGQEKFQTMTRIR